MPKKPIAQEPCDCLTQLVEAARALIVDLDALNPPAEMEWIYNPLQYAWQPYHTYLSRYATQRVDHFFLGMNPGPWGMAQTGVPFGEIESVKSWLKIDEPVGRPSKEHPKRIIEGFACKRSEVSGKRLWGFFADEFASPSAFFANHFVANYCPLVFMDDGARNITPDKLPKAYRAQLDLACDRHLMRSLRALQPKIAVGIGGYAENCLARVCAQDPSLSSIAITKILHPSPASPAANKNWAQQVRAQLVDAGILK